MIDHETQNVEDDEFDKTLANRIFTFQGAVTDILPSLNVQEHAAEDSSRAHSIGYAWRVALTIIDVDVQIVFDFAKSAIIGRAFPGGIDLSAFDALQLGVSRRHAVLSLQENKIVIRDCGSKNGTLLNSKKLKPNVNYILRSGDLVHLARMALRFDLLYNPYENPLIRDRKP